MHAFPSFVRDLMCCSVLQCVAVCYNVLQCVAVCYSVLQCVADTVHDHWKTCGCFPRLFVTQYVTVCCSVRVTRMNESCHTYSLVMLHIFTSHVIHMNESLSHT